MCLKTVEKRAAVAEKTITCYKVVYCPVSGKRVAFKSIFQDFKYTINRVRFEKKFRCKTYQENIVNCIFEGFHSYTTIKAAKDCSDNSDYILKCEIPAGSRYFTNQFSTEYCSNRIKVTAWRKATETAWHTEKTWHEAYRNGYIKARLFFNIK